MGAGRGLKPMANEGPRVLSRVKIHLRENVLVVLTGQKAAGRQAARGTGMAKVVPEGLGRVECARTSVPRPIGAPAARRLKKLWTDRSGFVVGMRFWRF